MFAVGPEGTVHGANAGICTQGCGLGWPSKYRVVGTPKKPEELSKKLLARRAPAQQAKRMKSEEADSRDDATSEQWNYGRQQTPAGVVTDC